MRGILHVVDIVLSEIQARMYSTAHFGYVILLSGVAIKEISHLFTPYSGID